MRRALGTWTDRGDPLPPKQTSPAQQAGHEARGGEARGGSRESEERIAKKAKAERRETKGKTKVRRRHTREPKM